MAREYINQEDNSIFYKMSSHPGLNLHQNDQNESQMNNKKRFWLRHVQWKRQQKGTENML